MQNTLNLPNQYGGLPTSEQITNVITQKVQSIINKEVQKIQQEIQKQISSKMSLIKAEIYGSYTTIVKRTFVNVFNAYYGINYNIQSLLDSINFNSGNGLIPDFSYDENKFLFDQELDKEDLSDRHTRFNKNAGLTDEFVRFSDPRLGRNSARYHDDNLENAYREQYNEAKETIEDYENGNSGINLNEYNESLDFIQYLDKTRGKPVNNMKRVEWYIGLKKVYALARQKALEQFQNEYNMVIKPRCQKKYGIKL